MSDLSDFAAHARRMAGAKHKPECLNPPEIPAGVATARDAAGREIGYTWQSRIPAGIPRACPGCVTDADRAMWARLAREATEWLERDKEEEALWS